MCVLRVSGDFDPAEVLASLKLKASHAFKAGEPRFASKPEGRKNAYSGFTVNVSDADWTLHELAADAQAFIEQFETDLVALGSMAVVVDVRLDFPVDQRNVVVQSEYFPPALVRAAGRAGIGLEITFYPGSDDEADNAERDGADGAAQQGD